MGLVWSASPNYHSIHTPGALSVPACCHDHAWMRYSESPQHTRFLPSFLLTSGSPRCRSTQGRCAGMAPVRKALGWPPEGDGAVARYKGKTSYLGGFMDGTLDRFVDLFIVLAIYFNQILGMNSCRIVKSDIKCSWRFVGNCGKCTLKQL